MDYTKPLSREQKVKLAEYSANEMHKLKQMSDLLLKKLGDVDQYQKDDFYSIANEELLKAVLVYDEKKCDNFHNYLKSNCERKFCTQLRDIQRSCRSDRQTYKDKDGNEVVINHKDKRLDAPLSDDGHGTICDTIVGTSMEKLFDAQMISSERCLKYLNKLSKKQRIVLSCIVRGYTKPQQIKEQTGYSMRVVRDCIAAIKDANNTKILYKEM